MDHQEKKHSKLFAILGTASILPFLYLLGVYSEILGKSIGFIKNHYPSISKTLLFFWVPWFIFYIILAAYSKSEETLNFKITKFKYKGMATQTLHFFLTFGLFILLLFNIFSIYIYIKHIGENPFTLWNNHTDIRQLTN